MSENKCVCCDEIIPEGRQVCPSCEKKSITKYKGIDIETIRKIQFENVPSKMVSVVRLEETIKEADVGFITSMQSEIERFVQQQVDRRVEEAELLGICEMAILYLKQRNVMERIMARLKDLERSEHGAIKYGVTKAIATVKEEGGIHE